jgi:hypothetical protein
LGLAAVGGAAWAADALTGGPSEQLPKKQVKRPSPGLKVTNEKLPSGVAVPTAEWVVDENKRAGTLGWILEAPAQIAGFANLTSAVKGDAVSIYVDSPSTPYHIELYRMGYYGGLGGRLVLQSAELPIQAQQPASLTRGTNMIECQWQASFQVKVRDDWPTGSYLFKLVASDGSSNGYVPLCIREDVSTAAFVIMNAVTNWQAYNTYGGYSLYTSPSGAANRSRVVSFDRPYYHPNVESDFFGNEFPLIFLAERAISSGQRNDGGIVVVGG